MEKSARGAAAALYLAFDEIEECTGCGGEVVFEVGVVGVSDHREGFGEGLGKVVIGVVEGVGRDGYESGVVLNLGNICLGQSSAFSFGR